MALLTLTVMGARLVSRYEWGIVPNQQRVHGQQTKLKDASQWLVTGGSGLRSSLYDGATYTQHQTQNRPYRSGPEARLQVAAFGWLATSVQL